MKTFESHARWISGKKGELTFENGRRIEFSSPVDFGGVEGSVVPEELLVASLNACLHMTFLAIAQKMRLEIKSFKSEAEGHLDTIGDKTQFVKCTLRPRILMSSSKDVSRAEKAISLAKKRCFVANSVNFRVSVEPSIQAVGTSQST